LIDNVQYLNCLSVGGLSSICVTLHFNVANTLAAQCRLDTLAARWDSTHTKCFYHEAQTNSETHQDIVKNKRLTDTCSKHSTSQQRPRQWHVQFLSRNYSS